MPTTGATDAADALRGAAPADRRWRLRHLPVMLAASAAMLVVAAGVGGWLTGAAGAVGAAVGVAVATLSFTASTLVIAYADRLDPKLVMPFGMGTYIAKVSLFGGLLLGVSSTGWAGLVPLGWGIAAGVLAWSAAQIWWIAAVHVPATRR
jgi:hypothetical protein